MKLASLVVAMGLTVSVVAVTSCGGTNYLAGTEDPPGGDVHAFDPIAQIPAVAEFAGGGAQLVKINATGVRSSGTQDLEANYYPQTEYDFVRPAQQRADLPVGAQPVTTSLEDVRVKVRKANFVTVVGQGDFFDRGMEKDTSNADRNPPDSAFSPCHFADLWKLAQTKGAQPDAVAQIAYEKGLWKFDVIGTRTSLVFDSECALSTGDG